MEKADLYAIENDINSIYLKVSEDKEISSENEFLMNSILYHYTQSYLLKKTFAGSAMFEDKAGHSHVGLISFNEIENEMATVEANSFLAANFDYIDTESKNAPEGFAIHTYKKHNKNFGRLSGKNDINDPKKPILLRLSSLLKDYPLAKIPSSAFIEFGDIKFKIDKFYGNKIYTFPDIATRRKSHALTMDEIMSNTLGKKIMFELFKDPLYEKIFEQSTIAQKINLSEKREYKITLMDFNDPYKQLNELSKININEQQPEYKRIFAHLKNSGLNYIDNIKDQKALVAHNEYGIAGMLVFGDNFSEKNEKTKNKVLWLSSIATTREHRGNGVGVELFKQAAKYATENELILFITTFSSNGSQYIEKPINDIIKNEKLNNIITPDDIDRDFGMKIVDIVYGQTDNIEKNGKIYSLKKVESPYNEFTSIINVFRENSPNMENIQDSIDLYERLDNKRKLSDLIYEKIVDKLLDKEISKLTTKNTKINKNKP
jgi:GNAT superfamily N-acetyltransferase